MRRRPPRAIVFDSWAIMAYLEDEPPAEQIAEMIADAHEVDTALLMSVINVGEVWYTIARQTTPKEADRTVQELQQLGIEFVAIDWGSTREAAVFKSRHRLSYADCFAASLAKLKKAHLVTGDEEFRQVEEEITIIWPA